MFVTLRFTMELLLVLFLKGSGGLKQTAGTYNPISADKNL